MKFFVTSWTNVRERAATLVSSPVKRLAVAGTLWTIGSFGASQFMRLVSSLIMTRLLFPELFGLMSLVWTVIVGLALFSDVGLDTNVIRHPEGEDPSFLGTVWTVQIIRGLVLWLCCCAVAYPMALIYHDERLMWLLPAVGATALIAGFNSPAIYVLKRRLIVGPLVRFDLVGQFVGLIITAGWAYFQPTVAALAAGPLATSLVQLAISYRLDRQVKAQIKWDAVAVHDIISFGKWIFITTTLSFLAGQADRLVIGKLFSLSLLGSYGIALTLAEMPRSLISTLSARVIFPAFSRVVSPDRASFRAKIQSSRAPLLLVSAVGLAIFVGTGDFIVRFLYDVRYSAASWMVWVLALGSWPVILAMTIDPALYVIGKPKGLALANLWAFLFMTAALAAGAHWFGLPGAVAGVALSRIPFHVAIIAALRRDGIACIKQDALYSILFVACVVAINGIRLAVGLPTLIGWR